MNGFSTRTGLELANQRIDALQRDAATARQAKATSPRTTATAGRTLRTVLARPLGLLSVGR